VCTPYPAGGAYSALTDPQTVFKGLTSKGREEKWKDGKGGKGKVNGMEG